MTFWSRSARAAMSPVLSWSISHCLQRLAANSWAIRPLRATRERRYSPDSISDSNSDMLTPKRS